MIKYFGPCKFFIPKTDKKTIYWPIEKVVARREALLFLLFFCNTFFKTFFCNTIKQINIIYSIKGSLPIEGL